METSETEANVLEESGDPVGQHAALDYAKIPAADASLENGVTKKTSETEANVLEESGAPINQLGADETVLADMEDATDVEETPDNKMEAIDTLKELKNNDTVLAHKIKTITTRKFKMKNVKRAAQQLRSAQLTKPQNGATSDQTRLQNFWRERKDEKCFLLKIHETMECCEQKIKLHTTRYGNIVKESTQNLQTKKYHKCGHIHGSAKCCKTKFTPIYTNGTDTRCGDVHWSEELFMLMDRSVANVKSGRSAV